jgi:hypothetical protein
MKKEEEKLTGGPNNVVWAHSRLSLFLHPVIDSRSDVIMYAIFVGK